MHFPKLQFLLVCFIPFTSANCPVVGNYIKVGDCTAAGKCPEKAQCFNGDCCSNFGVSKGGGARCPGTGKHSTGRCKRQAYGCGGYRISICINGNCCPSGNSYVSCPTTGYVSTTACYSGCQSCYAGYCCPTNGYGWGSGWNGGWGGYGSGWGNGGGGADSFMCPSGTMSSTRCFNGVCQVPGSICVNGFCCPPYGGNGGVGGVGDSVTCPNLAVVSMTRCDINNVCVAIPTQICYQGFCCPGTMCPPNRVMSTTPCTNGVCQTPGQFCFNGFCCQQQLGVGIPGVGGTGPGVGGIGGIAGSVICPATGTLSRTPCMNDVCTLIPDLGCHAGFCCPMTSSVTCPMTGITSTTACVDNVCTAYPGQTCIRGFCCQTSLG